MMKTEYRRKTAPIGAVFFCLFVYRNQGFGKPLVSLSPRVDAQRQAAFGPQREDLLRTHLLAGG